MNASFPIIIKTNNRDFEWDIQTNEDWAVIDSVITSIKKGWDANLPKEDDN